MFGNLAQLHHINILTCVSRPILCIVVSSSKMRQQ